MKKSILILLSVLLTCTILTSCKIGKAIKNATIPPELKRAPLNSAARLARINAANAAIGKSDSIQTEKMSEELYDSISLNETTEMEEK